MKSISTISWAEIYKYEGSAGLVKKINSRVKKRDFVSKLILFDKKYFFAYKFLVDIAKLDNGIPKYGVAHQASDFIRKFGLEPSVYTDINNANFNSKKGLLIYGINHNASIEPEILFSILKQKNIRLLFFRPYYHLGVNIRNYCYPIASRSYAVERNSKLMMKLHPRFRFLKYENLSAEDITKINQDVLASTVKTLEKGGVVIIFPAGDGDEYKKWRTGLSRILMAINKEKREEIDMIPVYFSGLGVKRLYFRIFKTYRKIKQAPLRVGVYFGKEKSVSELFNLLGNRITEEKIINYLRKDAFSQYGIKEFPLKHYLYPKNYPLALTRSALIFSKLVFQFVPFKDIFK